MPLENGLSSLTVHAGATGRDLADVAALLASAVYLDFRPVGPGDTTVSLIFRDLPEGVSESSPWRGPVGSAPDVGADAVTMPGDVTGWVPTCRRCPTLA